MIMEFLRKERRRVIAQAPKICFVHVPKCAGSSLRRAIQRNTYGPVARLATGQLALDTRACERAAVLEHSDFPTVATALASYHLFEPHQTFVCGHFHCPLYMIDQFADAWNFLTVLRHPVDRFISAYVYDTYKEGDLFKNEMPLEQFLESQRGYYEGKIYLYHFSDFARSQDRSHTFIEASKQQVLRTLERFRLVGTLDRMDAWLAEYERIFGRRLVVEKINRGPKPDVAAKLRADKAVMRRIEELCASSLEIYERLPVGAMR